jgi:3-hydroxyacyl-CoA dehydrogenase / enoyl-CoA hydratase / 3-hydroxybutyryl-CoA epimerase
MAYNRISFEEKDQIIYIGFGHNSKKAMTVLDEETLTELDAAVTEVGKKQKDLKGLIFFSHLDRCFIAGADINLIHSMSTQAEGTTGAESGQKIFNNIEDLSCPTLAAVNGVCLGGGFELALSCDKIIVSEGKQTQLGLPEVQLGLIPGFGGTYRLPKKVGIVKALDLILSGKKIDGKKAKRLGIAVDVYAKERLLTMALKVLSKKEDSGSFKDSLENLASDNFFTRKIVFQKARESVLKKTKGHYQAPLKILDVMERGLHKNRTSYLSMESQAFGELCMTLQSRNLRHIFFMSESAKKYPRKPNEKKLKLKRGAVLGAGTMGGGIAWLLTEANMAPIMKDIGVPALELGLKQASSNFKSALKRKKICYDEFERKMRSITPQLTYDGFKSMDLFIEAIVEDMKIKKSVLSEVEKNVRNDAIITSNTSSLSIEEMKDALEYSERFMGLHFFNPVHRMPLVEIITHSKVSEADIEAVYNWCLKVKKTPIIVKDGPGFLVNRILMPYLNEALYLLEEGVEMSKIESACLNFGLPMGPCRLMDEVGIDVAAKVAKILNQGLGDRAKPTDLSDKILEKKFLGRKNKKGFYNYEEAKEVPNTECLNLLPKKKIEMDEITIQMRLILPMINEASYILEEGIVETAKDVDLGLIFGIGFPPFRGGLLKYADNEGVDRMYKAIVNLSQTVSEERYKPSAYFKNLVEKKTKFYEE